MEEHERIELRSDDVQEIIGTPPRWIVRWGTLIVSSIVLMLIAMTFIVKYPDKVTGDVIITSKVAAIRVNAQQSGYISQIFYKDNEKVERGDLLMVMQNSADYIDVDELEELMEEFQDWNKEEIIDFDYNEFPRLELGRLQPLYSKFQTDFEEFQFKELAQAGAKQVARIRVEINKVNDGIEILKRQKEDAQRVLKEEKRKFDRIRNLVISEDLPKVDLDNQRIVVINAQTRIDEFDAQINNKSQQSSQLATRIGDIQSTTSETNNDKYISLKSSINNLLSAIDDWNEQNLLMAAVDGKVSMVDNWSSQQYVTQGTEIMAILPEGSDKDSLFTRLYIPFEGSGKVDIDQKVLLRFKNYPYREYGQVNAVVTDLPGLPRDGKMPVKIELTNGLITRSKKVLKFEQEMHGYGDIITEDKTVFERIFENIIKPLMDE